MLLPSKWNIAGLHFDHGNSKIQCCGFRSVMVMLLIQIKAHKIFQVQCLQHCQSKLKIAIYLIET